MERNELLAQSFRAPRDSEIAQHDADIGAGPLVIGTTPVRQLSGDWRWQPVPFLHEASASDAPRHRPKCTAASRPFLIHDLLECSG